MTAFNVTFVSNGGNLLSDVINNVVAEYFRLHPDAGISQEALAGMITDYFTENPIESLTENDVENIVTGYIENLHITDGADGKSAYQIAIDNGFTGTEEQWLASLKGAKGDKGNTGAQGVKGDKGDTGNAGADGKSAYELAVDNGFEGTESEWLESLHGEDANADVESLNIYGEKNYFKVPAFSKTYSNGITLSADENGEVTVNGTGAWSMYENIVGDLSLVNGTYTIKGNNEFTDDINAGIHIQIGKRLKSTGTTAFVYKIADYDYTLTVNDADLYTYYYNISIPQNITFDNFKFKPECTLVALSDGTLTNVTLTKKINKVGGAYNVLKAKKWAVCGDSFTAGDGIIERFTDGLYANQLKVYPYIIADRNDMELQMMAQGGKTLAKPQDNSFNNCFANIFATIESDIDYITLYFGINDYNHNPDRGAETGNIPLGSITDSTLFSFYGAWNVILPYLMEHYPNAKIGIIVSNGGSNDYRQATIECAKKWGIPYIDLNGDERTPMMIHSTNPNIAQSAKDIVNAKWRVSSENGHPNEAAHAYESTIIENFLRSL